MKICLYCKKIIPANKRKHALYCSERCCEYGGNQRRRKTEQGILKDLVYKWKKYHGIDITPHLNEIKELKKKGVCEICKKVFKSLNIDHDHVTKKIRGMLCVNCNFAIGNFKEDTDIIKEAIKYLEKYKK